MFYFELRDIISISCVAWSHESRNNIEYILWKLTSEYFIKAAQFPVGILNLAHDSFSLDVPLIAPVIANTELY